MKLFFLALTLGFLAPTQASEPPGSPPPKDPHIIDATGAAQKPGNCNVQIVNNFPEFPTSLEHQSDSGMAVNWNGSICGGWKVNGGKEKERVQRIKEIIGR